MTDRLSSKIYVAGHSGMVGSACWRLLKKQGYKHLIGKTSDELDLRNQHEVNEFIKEQKPDIIIDAAAKVGGILANNTYPFPFLMDNLQIQNNLINAAHQHNVSKFIFLGSSCIYPRQSPQPIKEDQLLNGPLEPTNQWYAIAKITGVKLCQAIRQEFNKEFVSMMPTNLYGQNDNFDLESSHVLPAMIRKFHEAKLDQHAEVTLWGDGSPLREFLHVDDLANAVIFALNNRLPHHLYNVGSGTEISIKELAKVVQKVVGHHGEICWDTSKPNGTPRKLMDSTRIRQLGWTPSFTLERGIKDTYQWFLQNTNNLKKVSFEN